MELGRFVLCCSQETLSSVFCTAVRGAVPWPAIADLWPVLQQDIQVVVGERRQLREVVSNDICYYY